MKASLRRWGLAFLLGGAAVAARGAELVWAELVTNGIPAEMAPFYEKTLGWTSDRAGKGPRDAVRFSRNGRPVAGLSYRPGEKMERPRARWVVCFGSEDVAATAARAREEGGVVLEPDQPRGRGVLVADSEGAVFGVWRVGDGAESSRGLWPVVLARDTAGAAAFYRTVFGGGDRAESRTPLFAGDFLLTSEGKDWAGVQPTGVSGGAGWMLLVGVADIEATAREARRAGGRVLREPKIDLIGGRVAVIADPVGGVFGLYESLPVRAPRGARPDKAGGAAPYEVEALSR